MSHSSSTDDNSSSASEDLEKTTVRVFLRKWQRWWKHEGYLEKEEGHEEGRRENLEEDEEFVEHKKWVEANIEVEIVDILIGLARVLWVHLNSSSW